MERFHRSSWHSESILQAKKMKTSRATTGRFQTRLSFSTDEIDDICLEALAKGGYMPKEPGPVRVERFVEKYFQCNAGYEDLPPGAMGYSLFDAKGKVIEVRVSSKLEDGKKFIRTSCPLHLGARGGPLFAAPNTFH